MDLVNDIDFKSLVIGAAISAGIVIIASQGYDWLMLMSSVGLLYVGYKAKNVKYGAILGAIASTPIVYLTFIGTLGEFSGYFSTQVGTISVVILILLIGALIGFVGALMKRSREKAKIDYEKKQKIGKNKNKKKNNN
ncbi:hypothetical protein [Methanobrevibacter sp.]|uniref:hypothetical protein n=1 Tax=Methanobrevibacter sp. TaxID=66852 RepID=UPI0025D0F0B0|nr:hypothetical protein [Methanobrevibacter sp.]MEE0024104.1 hypothetical protein [Methanobrevibacter sp.]